jgi:hypothetical protein
MAPLLSYSSYVQLRWLLKPIKRSAFARGRAFTERYSRMFIQKYVLKFMKKHAKLHGQSEAESAACSLSPEQMQQLMVRVTDLVTSDMRDSPAALEATLVATTRAALQKASVSAEPSKSTRASFKVDLGRARSSKHARPKSPTLLMTQTEVALDLEASSPRTYAFAAELATYAVELGRAVDKNIGLDHSKARADGTSIARSASLDSGLCSVTL